MGFVSSDMVPILIAMIVIVPWTYDVVKNILENKLDFDVFINLKILRMLEALIALSIFPTASMFILLKIVDEVLKDSLKASYGIVNFLISPRIIEAFIYYTLVLFTFLSLNIGIIILLKFIYASL